MVCPGARFAVYLAITTLLNPGDEVIVIEPAWPAYKDCALNAGIKVRTIKTTLETKWEPSIDQINNAINENTNEISANYEYLLQLENKIEKLSSIFSDGYSLFIKQ